MIRRVFLKILTSSTVVLVSGLTTPIRLLAEWNESAFSAKNIDSAINSYFPNKEIKRNDRFIQYGLIAASMAVEDSGIEYLNELEKLEVGISAGSGIGGLETIYNGSITVNESKKLSPFFIPSSLVNLLSGQISIKYGFKGPNHSVVTACATGANSIGDATGIPIASLI